MSRKFAFLGWIIAAALVGLYAVDLRPAIVKEGSYIVIGRVENAYIDEANISLKARIDSGAGVTSINAKIIKIHKSKTEKLCFLEDPW